MKMSLTDEIWDYPLDIQQIEDGQYQDFHTKVLFICESITNLLDEEVLDQKCCTRETEPQNPNVDLKILVEQNRQCQSDIDSKLIELNLKLSEYENNKQERKLLTQEIKETHEAFLMTKKYYKKFLKIYFTIEKSTDIHQIVFLQFFTESKKETDDYSVRLQRDIKTRQYFLLETSPKLKNLSDIQKELEETHDVPGSLSHIRDCFVKIKSSRK